LATPRFSMTSSPSGLIMAIVALRTAANSAARSAMVRCSAPLAGTPGVLVEARQLAAAAREPDEPEREHALGIGHVEHHLAQAPLARGVAKAAARLRRVPQHRHQFGSLPLQLFDQVPATRLAHVATVVRRMLIGRRLLAPPLLRHQCILVVRVAGARPE